MHGQTATSVPPLYLLISSKMVALQRTRRPRVTYVARKSCWHCEIPRTHSWPIAHVVRKKLLNPKVLQVVRLVHKSSTGAQDRSTYFDDGATHEDGSMKILLAIDGSPCSDDALEEIHRRPWPVGSEFKVLTTFELSLPPTPEAWSMPSDYFQELDRVASEHARSIVERAVKKLRSSLGSQANIKGEAVLGPPRVVILDEAENWGADLIVVGSHGYPPWKRVLLGSVSQSIVSHAKCSVEVVRCRQSVAIAEGTSRSSQEVKQWPRL